MSLVLVKCWLTGFLLLLRHSGYDLAKFSPPSLLSHEDQLSVINIMCVTRLTNKRKFSLPSWSFATNPSSWRTTAVYADRGVTELIHGTASLDVRGAPLPRLDYWTTPKPHVGEHQLAWEGSTPPHNSSVLSIPTTSSRRRWSMQLRGLQLVPSISRGLRRNNSMENLGL